MNSKGKLLVVYGKAKMTDAEKRSDFIYSRSSAPICQALHFVDQEQSVSSRLH